MILSTQNIFVGKSAQLSKISLLSTAARLLY